MVRMNEADFVLCEVQTEVLTRINLFGRTWVEDQFLPGSLRTQRTYRKRSAFMACQGLKL